jgi:hypothetical protein
MKKTCLAFGAMVLAMGISQVNAESLIPAEDVPGEFSASMLLGTDYIFRGVSQNSSGTPTIQGSIDYSGGKHQFLRGRLGIQCRI